MATSFKKTTIKSYPRVGEKVTTDTLYWKNYEFPITKKEFGAVTDVAFSPVDPYNYAVTSSARVQIYSSRTHQSLKTLSKFKSTAYGASFRGDGKLLVSGEENRGVWLFDANSGSVLRMLTGHSGAVRVTKFLNDNLRIMSGSDDKTVKIWDIACGEETASFDEHQDYVRCGACSQASKDIIITGSYDHTVKMFDTRLPNSVFSVDHGHPVESVLMFPNGGIFLSAGSNTVKVWDALAGGKLLAAFSNHRKTIMDMCLCNNNHRLATASLDRHVKIYDVTTYQVVHTLEYHSAILSLGMDPKDDTIAVGMADGLLSIQKRKQDIAEVKPVQKKKASYKYAVKYKSYAATKVDHSVEHHRKQKLAKYDKYLKRFEHSKALDVALDLNTRTKHPEITVSVLQELIRRDRLEAALAGRDEKGIYYLLRFIQRNISKPRFMSTLVDVANCTLDVYSDKIGNSAVVDDILVKLKKTTDSEINYMKKLMDVMGTMDMLLAASEQSTDTHKDNSELTDVMLQSPTSTATSVSLQSPESGVS